MVRSTTAVIAAVLVLVPGIGLAQQVASGTDENAAPRPRSSPEAMAVRKGVAAALDRAITFQKSIPTPPTGSWGIESEGTGGGGIFRDSDSEAEAWLGAEEVGVHGFGALAGGKFWDSDATGYAWVGHSDAGIEAGGSLAGGFFVDSDDDGEAWVGHGNYGIEARGSEMGGYFEDRDGSGFAHLGWGNTGVFGRGNVAGGAFDDRDGSGYARVGYGDRGVDAGGNEMGGYFEDSDGTGYAYVGYGEFGIEAHGVYAGGFFEPLDETSYAEVGRSQRGIRAGGTRAGGFFEDLNGDEEATLAGNGWGIRAQGSVSGGEFFDTDLTGWAWVASHERGIEAHGTEMGGFFDDMDGSGYSNVGYGDRGIEAFGNGAGGHFEDLDEGAYANVAISTFSIAGNGTKAFVQNHPYDRDSVIVYAAPEGDEVATYTRGTARLLGGEATVSLSETFKWVTNPDIGLTASLTPVGEWCDLYVVEKATNEITVRSRDGSDCSFDYMVYGLRIGFEESSVVQEKEQESYIPSMAGHRQLYQRRPDLRRHNSLERFKGMHHAISPKARLDMSRAQALRDAIVEFDPAVHELPRPPGFGELPGDDLASEEARPGTAQAHERVRAARGDGINRRVANRSDHAAAIPVDAEGNVYAPSFRSSSGDLATRVNVSESVEAGDVLVINRDTAGMMRRGFEGHDPGVVGVVSENADIVLGSRSPVLANEEPGTETALRAEVALAGVVSCKVDAGYGAIWPGDLLVTSPTLGHAMRTESPLPGTIVGKALEPLEGGTGLIKVLVMLR